MSGGSFNYLFTKDAADILAGETSIFEMVAYLQQIAPGSKAYRDAGDMLVIMAKANREIETLKNGLRAVFKAAEWSASGDLSKEDALKAIEEYEAR